MEVCIAVPARVPSSARNTIANTRTAPLLLAAPLLISFNSTTSADRQSQIGHLNRGAHHMAQIAILPTHLLLSKDIGSLTHRARY